jgi:hypothetical protein
MWNIGTADIMFAVESTKSIVWNDEKMSYSVKAEDISNDDDDSNWRLSQSEGGSTSSEAYSDNDNCAEEDIDSEDFSWCSAGATMQTWEHCVELGTKISMRAKYQLMPLVL